MCYEPSFPRQTTHPLRIAEVNPILGVLGALLPLVPPLNIDTETLLGNAAAGAPITLQALNANGVIVGPANQCDATADSFQLNTPRGFSIGGNRITGLGATGQEAAAGELNSIAFGNRALTDAAALNSLAIRPRYNNWRRRDGQRGSRLRRER